MEWNILNSERGSMKIIISIEEDKKICFQLNKLKVELNIEEEELNKIDQINDFIISVIDDVELEKSYDSENGKNITNIANELFKLLEKEINEVKAQKAKFTTVE